ncbi:MAG: hypothetical protein HC828_21120 [Blastochloris sp.]|nr:hypothetical protein [Blastochloris sp.]
MMHQKLLFGTQGVVVRAYDCTAFDTIMPPPDDAAHFWVCVLGDTRWQAQQPDGLDVSCFALDWAVRQAICPAGKVSVSWVATHDLQGAGQDIVAIQFDASDCHTCPLRSRCTQAQKGGRNLRIRPREQYEALQRAPAPSDRGVSGTLHCAVRD